LNLLIRPTAGREEENARHRTVRAFFIAYSQLSGWHAREDAESPLGAQSALISHGEMETSLGEKPALAHP